MSLSSLALLLVSALPQAPTPVPKTVVAPPDDILSGTVRLPAPASVAVRSGSALLDVVFTAVPDARGASVELDVPVDDPDGLALGFSIPEEASWNVRVRPPGATAFLDLRRAALAGLVERQDGAGLPSAGGPAFRGERYDVSGVAPGVWRVRVESSGGGAARAGRLLVRGARDLTLAAWLSGWNLVADQELAVLAAVDAGGGAGTAVALERAEVRLATAFGELALTLEDDGLHADGAAGDGVLGAWIPPALAGGVQGRVLVAGTRDDGFRRTAFVRTTELAFTIVPRRARLTGAARLAEAGDDAVLEVETESFGAPRKLLVAAEVWGADGVGQSAPLVWLARMVVPTPGFGAVRVPFARAELDAVARDAALELRNLRLQDPDTQAVLGFVERVDLPRLALRTSDVDRAESDGTPLSRAGAALGDRPGPNALLLSHGWCAGGNPWPLVDFSQPLLVFSDPDQNRSHDQFAQLLYATAADRFSFGVLGHSQGGCAALHLLTFYQSGLDRSGAGRRIQSVATPYQGTPLASLGGFACGVNNDLTTSGAAAWLSTIPTSARSRVWYRTVSNSGSACNALSDFLLTNPDDGVVERTRGQLPGANNLGHVTGWCHTTGMSNPACYTDHVRNQELDAAAGR